MSTHRNGEQFISYLVTSLSKIRHIKAMLEIKWSHFDDCSVKGINNDPKSHSAFLETALPLSPLEKKSSSFLSSLALARSFLPRTTAGEPQAILDVRFLLSFQTPPQFSSVLSNWGLTCCRGELGATLTPHVVTKLERFLCQKRLCVTSPSGSLFSTWFLSGRRKLSSV